MSIPSIDFLSPIWVQVNWFNYITCNYIQLGSVDININVQKLMYNYSLVSCILLLVWPWNRCRVKKVFERLKVKHCRMPELHCDAWTPLYIQTSIVIFIIIHVDINFHSLCLCPGLISGLDITSTQSMPIEKASGQTVKLDCQFTLAPEDSGPLDIEWSLLSSDNQKEDKVVRVDVPYKQCCCKWQLSVLWLAFI